MKTKHIIKKIIEYFANNELSSKIFVNSSWLISNNVFAMLIGVFVTSIVARYFGAEKYGHFNYALSFTALFSALSTLGLSTLTVKSIVDKDYPEGTILCTSLLLRTLSGIIVTALSMIIIVLWEPDDKILHVLVLIMSFTMMTRVFEVIEYWTHAYQKAKISSIIRMSVYVFSSSLKVVVVVMNGNLYHYAIVYGIDALLVGIALIIAYFKFRHDTSKWKISFTYAKEILSKSWYLIVSGLMITLYMRVDQIMLGHMIINKTELGIYSAAVAVASMWYFVPMSVITSFSPVIMRQKKTNEVAYLNSMQLLYCIVTWMSIGFGVVILLFSKFIISILYGAEYLEAANVLTISIWAGTFALIGTARSVWLVNEGLQRYSMTYTSAGFIINLVLNLILIPVWGAYGAAFATLVAQFVANVVILAFFKKTKLSSIMILKAFSPVRTVRLAKQILGTNNK